eukprot:539793-Amphidinium_carterae.1
MSLGSWGKYTMPVKLCVRNNGLAMEAGSMLLTFFEGLLRAKTCSMHSEYTIWLPRCPDVFKSGRLLCSVHSSYRAKVHGFALRVVAA